MNDQIIVTDRFALRGAHRVRLGIEPGNGILDPGGAGWNVIGFVALRDFFGENTATDESPNGLVVMFGGGLNDGHRRWIGFICEQRRHGNASTAAAYGDNWIVILPPISPSAQPRLSGLINTLNLTVCPRVRLDMRDPERPSKLLGKGEGKCGGSPHVRVS